MVACGDFNSTPGSAAHGLLFRYGGQQPSRLQTRSISVSCTQPRNSPTHCARLGVLPQRCEETIACSNQKRLSVCATAWTREWLSRNVLNCREGFFWLLGCDILHEDTLCPVALLELPGEKDMRTSKRFTEHAVEFRSHLFDDLNFNGGGRDERLLRKEHITPETH